MAEFPSFLNVLLIGYTMSYMRINTAGVLELK